MSPSCPLKLCRKEKLGGLITKQNRKYITKEVGKLLSDIWRINGLAQQEFGSHHPITRKLGSMYADAQKLFQEMSDAWNRSHKEIQDAGSHLTFRVLDNPRLALTYVQENARLDFRSLVSIG